MDKVNLVENTWHYLNDDKLSWDFIAGIIRQNNGIEITGDEIKKEYKKFFKESTGYTLYNKCPKCNGKILPRKSSYGYFVGCSNFPECNFNGFKKK